jgi:hypothetical protein
VEVDSYLLQVSRYIHRNPLEAGLVIQLSDYRWSSYPYYIDRRRSHAWLYLDEVLGQLGGDSRRYRRYVEHMHEEEEIAPFYERKHQAPILGSDVFIELVTHGLETDRQEMPDMRRLREPLSMKEIINVVVREYKVTRDALCGGKRPRGELTEARNMAMYLCQRYGQRTLKDIAEAFGLGHYSSVSSELARFRAWLEENKTLEARFGRVDKRVQELISNT